MEQNFSEISNSIDDRIENSGKVNTTSLTVDVIIPTYRSDHGFLKLIEMLYRQTVKPNRIIILHTEEYQGQEQPIPVIPGSNILIVPINKNSFDHGGTRRYGASLSGADILMFMTQDAIPANEYLIENLLKPYDDPWVGATYARQLANQDAGLIERFTRFYNYPKTSRVKSSKDIDELGIKTFFCSNVCATYRSTMYQELGGFVARTIFNEDMIMAARMIKAGCLVAYAADAKVIHSHNYTYRQQFQRNFDLGVSHRQFPDVFRGLKSESEGIKLVKKSLKYLISKKRYLLIPDLILSSGFKFLGYQIGLRYEHLPKKLIGICTMNNAYWR